jgi:hypothetical protein
MPHDLPDVFGAIEVIQLVLDPLRRLDHLCYYAFDLIFVELISRFSRARVIFLLHYSPILDIVTIKVVHAGAALVVNGWRTREYAFSIEYGIRKAIMIS